MHRSHIKLCRLFVINITQITFSYNLSSQTVYNGLNLKAILIYFTLWYPIYILKVRVYYICPNVYDRSKRKSQHRFLKQLKYICPSVRLMTRFICLCVQLRDIRMKPKTNAIECRFLYEHSSHNTPDFSSPVNTGNRFYSENGWSIVLVSGSEVMSWL